MMTYYDVEVLIQDVNNVNADIYNNGWMYICGPNARMAPLYFAPYFTKDTGDKPGLSHFSRVLRVEKDIIDNNLIEKYQSDFTGKSDLMGRWSNHWKEGMKGIITRASKEGFMGQTLALYFLDEPIQIINPPLLKLMLKHHRFPRIPRNYSRTFAELLTLVQLAPDDPNRRLGSSGDH